MGGCFVLAQGDGNLFARTFCDRRSDRRFVKAMFEALEARHALSVTCFEGAVRYVGPTEIPDPNNPRQMIPIPVPDVAVGDPAEFWFDDTHLNLRVGTYSFHDPIKDKYVDGGGFVTLNAEVSRNIGLYFSYNGNDLADNHLTWSFYNHDYEPRVTFNLQTKACDLHAKLLEYKPGATFQQDSLLVQYDAAKLNDDQTFKIGFYWSKDATFGGRTKLAYSVEAEHDGEMTIPISALAARPNSDIKSTHLVMHLDDIAGGSVDGDIPPDEGDIDANNYSSLDVLPDIVIDSLEWNEALGGLDVKYHVVNRGFVDQPIEANLYWQDSPDRLGGGTSAASQFILDRSVESAHVAALSFVPPLATTTNVVIRVDRLDSIDERDEQNGATLLLPSLAPTLTLVPEPLRRDVKDPLPINRKRDYDLKLTIENRSPVPLHFETKWRELIPTSADASQEVRDASSCTDARDAQTCRKPDRSFDGTGLKEKWIRVESHASRSVNLGSLAGGGFRRTWNWIPPLKDDVPSTLKFIQEQISAMARLAVTTDVDRQIASMLEKLGKEVGGVEGAGDILFDFTEQLAESLAPSVIPTSETASIDYEVDVTAVGIAGSVTTQRATAVTLGVPHEQQRALTNARALLAIADQYLETMKSLLVPGIDPTNVGSIIEAAGGVAAVEATIDTFLKSIPRIVEQYRQALDPPDTNFQRLVSVAAEPAAEDGSFWARQKELREVISSWEESIATATDRRLGAEEANDLAWQAEHILAISEAAYRQSFAYSRLIAGEALKSPWIEARIGSEPLGEMTVEERDQFRNLLLYLGVEGADADFLTGVVAPISNRNILGRHNPLVGMARIQSGLAAEAATANLLQAIGLRVDQLGESVQPVAQADLDDLAGQQTKVIAMVGQGIVTEEWNLAIRHYLDDTRRLLLATNNVDVLLGHLKTGHGALAMFQYSATRPKDVAQVVSGWVTSGGITSDAAARISSALLQSDEAMRTTNLTVTSVRLLDIETVLDQLQPHEISDASRESLRGYLSWLESLMPATQTMGDANWDGLFNSSDLVQVFQSGQYETGRLSCWDEGDWNNDGAFDSSDLVAAFQAGTYENAAAVIESLFQGDNRLFDDEGPEADEQHELVDALFAQ